MWSAAAKHMVICCLTIVLATVGGFFYMNRTRVHIETQARQTLFEQNRLYARLIEERHVSYIKNLATLAHLLERQDASTPEDFLKHLKGFTDFTLFERMGVITPDGKGLAADGRRFLVAPTPPFRNALSGVPSFDTLSSSPLSTTPLCVYLSPIVKDGKTVAVLFASLPSRNFVRDTDDIQKAGQLVITDGSGTIFYASEGYLQLEGYNNIFTFLNESEESTIFSSKIFRKNDGEDMFVHAGIPYYIVHWVIDNGARWHVYSLVSEARLTAKTKEIHEEILYLLTVCGALSLFSLFTIVFFQRRNILRSRRDKERLDAIIENIPGGIFSCNLDDKQSFDFVSHGLLTLLGYDRKTFLEKTGGGFQGLLLPEKRAAIFANLSGQLRLTGTIHTEHETKTADGRTLWLLTKGKRIASENGDQVYAVSLDITREKAALHELLLSQERHRIVTELSESVIFEYNLVEQSFYISSQFEKLFGTAPEAPLTTRSAPRKLGIHHEDIPAFRQLLRRTLRKDSPVPAELRFYRRNIGYIWCRVQALGIFNESGKPIRIVGSITDIDSQKRRTERLRFEAEQDALTGLANRNSTSRNIERCLGSEIPDAFHALVVIDMNHFKEINDTLGHLIGDRVLVHTAETLRSALRESDIAGRIGGDEFVVLIKNFHEKEALLRKLETLAAQIRFTLEGPPELPVSASIGVALFPQDGATYTELFRCADIAMYQSKRNPEHPPVFYDPSLTKG